MSVRRAVGGASFAAMLVATALAAPASPISASAAAPAARVSGPLLSVAPDSSLNCNVYSSQSDWLKFFSFYFARPAAHSCATLVSVTGVGLFGPLEFGDSTGHVGSTPLRAFRPVSQRIVPPNRSVDGALHVTTTVALPHTPLTLVQRDVYHDGATSMDTSVELRNAGRFAKQVVIYRTGDCFGGSDTGYGITDPGTAGCQQALQRGGYAQPTPASLFIRFQSTRGASRHTAGALSNVRDEIASGAPLLNDCDCRTPGDVAAALSWSKSIPAAGHTSVAHRLTMSRGGGRAASTVSASTATGPPRFVARVTSNGTPVPRAAVDFIVGSLTICHAVAGTDGVATCPFARPTPRFVASYFGDTTHAPSRTAFVPASPPPPTGFAGFPACAQFDRVSGFALVTAGDAHHELIGASTLAPPCPGVLYRAKAGGVTIGAMRGDRRTTTFVGDEVAGFEVLFIDTPFGTTVPGCHRVFAIDSRNGNVVDSYPKAGDPQPCITEVAGQKFR